ncbi:hypothetical protein P7C73_g227, partial [Tremellales sp. Uapishka_1]
MGPSLGGRALLRKVDCCDFEVAAEKATEAIGGVSRYLRKHAKARDMAYEVELRERKKKMAAKRGAFKKQGQAVSMEMGAKLDWGRCLWIPEERLGSDRVQDAFGHHSKRGGRATPGGRDITPVQSRKDVLHLLADLCGWRHDRGCGRRHFCESLWPAACLVGRKSDILERLAVRSAKSDHLSIARLVLASRDVAHLFVPSLVISMLSAIFLMVETLPPDLAQDHDNAREKTRSQTDVLKSLKVPHFGVAMIVFTLCFSWEAIFSVITYTEVSRGGWDLPVTSIGILITLGNLMYIILSPTVLPPLQKRYGPVTLLKAVLLAWPVLAFSLPFAQLAAGSARWLLWILLVCQLFFKNIGTFVWPLSDLYVMNLLDGYPEWRAGAMALSCVAGAVGRAVGPAIAGWLYSLSTKFPSGSAGRQLSWVPMLLFSALPVLVVRLLPGDEPLEKLDQYEALPIMENGGEGRDGRREMSQ